MDNLTIIEVDTSATQDLYRNMHSEDLVTRAKTLKQFCSTGKGYFSIEIKCLNKALKNKGLGKYQVTE